MTVVKLLYMAMGLAAFAASPTVAQDSLPGERLYNQRCASCHGTAEKPSRVGPSLVGVVGRMAGTAEGFKFSTALGDSGLTWDAQTLDTFLTNPAALVPGTRMATRIARADDRALLIEFLTAQP